MEIIREKFALPVFLGPLPVQITTEDIIEVNIQIDGKTVKRRKCPSVLGQLFFQRPLDFSPADQQCRIAGGGQISSTMV